MTKKNQLDLLKYDNNIKTSKFIIKYVELTFYLISSISFKLQFFFII